MFFCLHIVVVAADFAMNDAQQLHIGIVERHIPELGDLRWELCPEYLSEGRFWMIYFVLVHPKLDKYDALTLSSPQVRLCFQLFMFCSNC